MPDITAVSFKIQYLSKNTPVQNIQKILIVLK